MVQNKETHRDEDNVRNKRMTKTQRKNFKKKLGNRRITLSKKMRYSFISLSPYCTCDEWYLSKYWPLLHRWLNYVEKMQ